MSDDLVIKIFEQNFASTSESEGLLQLLLSYDGNERERVQLAVLKLSDGDHEKLKHNIQAAIVDYRDVLAWAEYPTQMESGATAFNTAPEDYQAILEQDRKQYRSWLAEQSNP